MNGRREICHCGCDKASHYFDTKGPGYCLSCKDCKGYTHESTPKPIKTIPAPPPSYKTPNRPHIACHCNACLAWDRRYRSYYP